MPIANKSSNYSIRRADPGHCFTLQIVPNEDTSIDDGDLVLVAAIASRDADDRPGPTLYVRQSLSELATPEQMALFKQLLLMAVLPTVAQAGFSLPPEDAGLVTPPAP